MASTVLIKIIKQVNFTVNFQRKNGQNIIYIM